MKRALTLCLALLTVLSVCLSSCTTEQAEETTAPLTEALTASEETKEELKTGDAPWSKKLTVEQVTSLPVANETMTKEELRQLALDYFYLQLSFHWMPDMDITDYPGTNFQVPGGKKILVGELYGGMPYQSLGTGNLYRWLEYYDEETGVFSFTKAFAENGGYGEGAAITDVKKDKDGNITYKKYRSMEALFNQCSVASFWGWGRVVNSANFVWTADMNAFNGFIPLGFTYGYEYEGEYYGPDRIQRWGVKNETWNPTGYDTKNVISDLKREGGVDRVYQCYQMLRPGDCVVSQGHAMMVKDVILYYLEDGTVSLPMSSIIAIEQVEGWGHQGKLGEYKFKNQGGLDRPYAFGELMNKGYLPFTFAEYLDPAVEGDKALLDLYFSYANRTSPLAKRYSNFQFTNEELLAMTGAGVEKAVFFTNLTLSDTLSYEDFSRLAIGSNYVISDLFITVKDGEGKELIKNIYRSTSAQIREVSTKSRKSTWEYDEKGNAITVSHGVEALAGKGNTVEISIQVSTGEKLVVFSGPLTK